MKIILDGRRIGRGFSCYYLKDRAYFIEKRFN
jgi:hypothetical protein